MKEAIGGHRQPNNGESPGSLGLEVYRTEKGILKEAHCEADIVGLANEARMLRFLEGDNVAPAVLDQGEDWLLQEDLGKNQVVQDGEAFRRNAIRLLWTLRERNISHADLTGVNLIIRNDQPIAIDFQQSHLFTEERWPGQRTLCDAYYLWRFIAGTPSVQHPTPDTPRIARRWNNILASLTGHSWKHDLVGKTFIDFGCFQGDFVAMAACEGMNAHGIDQGGFRQGENSIEIARELWDYMGGPVRFTQMNIMDWPQLGLPADVGMMFSTWPYIVQERGREAAENLLGQIIEACGVFFFETQLKGDGPGPDFLLDDADVANMLGQWGKVEDICTISVTGRPASRTVWRVES